MGVVSPKNCCLVCTGVNAINSKARGGGTSAGATGAPIRRQPDSYPHCITTPSLAIHTPDTNHLYTRPHTLAAVGPARTSSRLAPRITTAIWATSVRCLKRKHALRHGVQLGEVPEELR